MKTKVEEKFTEFFERVSKLETTQLRQGEAELQALVAKVTTHVKAYYTAKWAAAHDDVLAFFCPVWLSPLENAYLWVTGWKPSTVFRLIESLRKSHVSSLKSLTEAQLKRIEELRVKIRLEEEKVEREMERQQVAMADRRMLELARLAGGGGGSATAVAGHVEGLVEVGLKSMFSGLERVMKAADCVRLKTLKGVLEELTPLQCVDFLASTCMLQIQLRQSGKKRSNYPSTTTQNNGLSNINRSDT
ncbi:TGA transcription factor [Trema orientale]|uniref:TGA transcription factor n=1 Tax=Trema orientale TaxID=63057 RepID=A0A2P5EP37_TREOI|nr:TGA transcription factor [Trema orientale]